MIQLSDRAKSMLAVGIDAAATTIQVHTADGDLFPPLTVAGDCFYAAIINASNNAEFVKVTARVASQLTVERGVAGTTARSFSAGSRFELRVIAHAWRELAANDWHRPYDDNEGLVEPVLVDASTFYVTGDFTAFFPQHRALKVSQTSPGFGYVASSSYVAGTNRTTVVVDSIALDSGLALVEAGHDVDASPRYPHAATADSATTAGSANDADTVDGKHASEFAGAVHNHPASEITDAAFGATAAKATQEQMELGEADDVVSTPLGVKQAIEALMNLGTLTTAELTGTGSLTVPDGVNWMFVDGLGAGGGGGAYVSFSTKHEYSGSGGGPGARCVGLVKVTPGETILYSVGTPGNGGKTSQRGAMGPRPDSVGESGGDTVFGNFICGGGKGGSYGTNTAGKHGEITFEPADGFQIVCYGHERANSGTTMGVDGANGGYIEGFGVPGEGVPSRNGTDATGFGAGGGGGSGGVFGRGDGGKGSKGRLNYAFLS